MFLYLIVLIAKPHILESSFIHLEHFYFWFLKLLRVRDLLLIYTKYINYTLNLSLMKTYVK